MDTKPKGVVDGPGFYVFKDKEGNEFTKWVDHSTGEGLVVRRHYRKWVRVLKEFIDFVPVEEYEKINEGKFIKREDKLWTQSS